jgi:hypothetical protein
MAPGNHGTQDVWQDRRGSAVPDCAGHQQSSHTRPRSGGAGAITLDQRGVVHDRAIVALVKQLARQAVAEAARGVDAPQPEQPRQSP